MSSVTKCPKCRKTTSKSSSKCPSCGYFLQSTLSKDAKDVSTVAAWLAFFITTAPLTTSIAILLSVAYKTTIDNLWKGQSSIGAYLILTIVILGVTAWFSDLLLGEQYINEIYIERERERQLFFQQPLCRPTGTYRLFILLICFILHILIGYFKFYGFWGFSCSVVMGIFLSWVWVTKVFPRM
jgi:hypothetical protein